MLRSGNFLANAAWRVLVIFLFGSYHGTRLIGPSLSLPSVLVYWFSYQPGPQLRIAFGVQRCLTISRVSSIASLRRPTTSMISALAAFAFVTSTERSRAPGS